MAPIPSSPATFNLTMTGAGGSVSQAVTFAIPAGAWTSGTFAVQGTAYNANDWLNSLQIIDTAYNEVALAPYGYSTGAFNVSANADTGTLSAINAAAGGSYATSLVWQVTQGPGPYLAISSFTLTLTGTGTGGTPTHFSVTQAGTGTNGCDTFVIQLLDSSGGAANAGGSGQVMTWAPSGSSQVGVGTATIPSGSSSATVTVCSKESGIFTVAFCPGAGPLVGLPCQSLAATFAGAPTDPNGALCAITRPNIRDAVRMHLGIATPLSTGTGFAGDEPPGQRYPTNFELNQAIADALRFINTECNLHMQVDIPIPISAPSATTVGPRIIPLAGIQGCPQSLSINTIRRCRFVDMQGHITRLQPTSYWEIDKNRWSYDNVPAANPPRWYMIDGYKLFILPAPSAAGTLYLYAGTAMQNFFGDTDTIDELPSDHQLTMEWIATAFVCLKKPDEPNNVAQYQGYMELAKPGVKNIRRFFQMMNEAYEPSVSADVARRRRVR